MAKTKTSFPQHMRNAQKALDALATECKKYKIDDIPWGDIVVTFDIENGVDHSVLIVNDDGDTFEGHGETVDDAATALLHMIAGTEEAPF